VQPPRSSGSLAHLCACPPSLLGRLGHAPAVAALPQPLILQQSSALPRSKYHCPACRCSLRDLLLAHEALRAPRQHYASRLEHTGGGHWCADCMCCCSRQAPCVLVDCPPMRGHVDFPVRGAPGVQAARLVASWLHRPPGAAEEDMRGPAVLGGHLLAATVCHKERRRLSMGGF